jgi:hypothetical protein
MEYEILGGKDGPKRQKCGLTFKFWKWSNNVPKKIEVNYAGNSVYCIIAKDLEK